jgi:hypothetical protein
MNDQPLHTLSKEELISLVQSLEHKLAAQIQWRLEIIDLIHKIFPHFKDKK